LEFIETGKIEDINNINISLEVEENVLDEKNEIKFRYCTEAYLEDVKINIKPLNKKLSRYGDSLIIAGSTEKMRVHIHTNEPAEFFSKLNQYSTIIDQKADDMLIQYNIKYNRISDIALVTDSIADLPQKYIDDNQIHVIPINLIIDNTNYLDKVTITHDEFYDLVDQSKEYPTSSQPTVKLVEDKLSFIADHYKKIIIITVSSKLSGTYQTVKSAIEKIDDNMLKYYNIPIN
jgi:dihydroxyacetone kinase-like predicted kinase